MISTISGTSKSSKFTVTTFKKSRFSETSCAIAYIEAKILKKCQQLGLAPTYFKYLRQALYFLNLPWVIRGNTQLG